MNVLFIGLPFTFFAVECSFVRKPRSVLSVLWSQVCMGHLIFLSTLADNENSKVLAIS